MFDRKGKIVRGGSSSSLTRRVKPVGFFLYPSLSFLSEDEERDKAHYDLENGGTGGGKTDQEQRSVSDALHQQSNGDPHTERSADPLKHHEFRFLETVVVADEAEQEAREQTVDSICLKIAPRVRDCRRVLREDPRQKIPAEEGQREHRRSEQKRDRDPVLERLISALGLAGTEILGDKRGHRLHKRAWHQHDEGGHFLSNAYSRGLCKSQLINDRKQNEERYSHQKILQCYRHADRDDFPRIGRVEPYVLSAELKREFDPADYNQRDNHTDQLRYNRCQCCARRSHSKPRHENQIADNIDNASDAYGDKRGF